MDERGGWGRDFAELRRCLDRAATASHDLADWMAMHLPENLPSEVRTLMEEISKAESLANQLSDRLHRGPLEQLGYGQPLSREAFFVLVALGVLNGGSYSGDAYEDFQMLRYEDGEQRGYITLADKPPPGYAMFRFGPWPEDISWQRLRPEQREFFDRHMPGFAARFRRDA